MQDVLKKHLYLKINDCFETLYTFVINDTLKTSNQVAYFLTGYPNKFYVIQINKTMANNYFPRTLCNYLCFQEIIKLKSTRLIIYDKILVTFPYLYIYRYIT